MYTLYIGNKNYSTWSLRGWLATKLSDAPFREVQVALRGTYNPDNRAFSPTALVPALHDGPIHIWDSLAIGEYLAERHPGMWPSDSAARAWARSIAAEMHSGFATLRNEMAMCIRERVDVRPWSEALVANIARVEEIWTESRRRFGAGGDFLCGAFSLADAFYGPVAFRFQTYGVQPAGDAGAYLRALLAHPFMREWEAAAVAETDIIEADEPTTPLSRQAPRNGSRVMAAMDPGLEALQATIRKAAEARTPLRIRGGGTKDFYGGQPVGDILETQVYAGIVDYDPTELVLVARAGTSLAAIESAMRARGQMLAFEPPHFGEGATLGGAVASGLSGPRRPYAGAVRDVVLGVRVLDGIGDDLSFGGRVMKNVAGFDVSRLMTGALGTLGVITEVSLKCLPCPKAEATLEFECSADEAVRMVNEWASQPLPLSATCYHDGHMRVRLSGALPAVATAAAKLGGTRVERAEGYWSSLRDHTHPFFAGTRTSDLALVALVRQVDGALYGPGRRTAAGMGWRLALARRGRSHRSATCPVVGHGEWRPRNTLPGGRQERRRVPPVDRHAAVIASAAEGRVRSARYPQSRQALPGILKMPMRIAHAN